MRTDSQVNHGIVAQETRHKSSIGAKHAKSQHIGHVPARFPCSVPHKTLKRPFILIA
jgi:hypothetical protein